jgi:hypothetical protein
MNSIFHFKVRHSRGFSSFIFLSSSPWLSRAIFTNTATQSERGSMSRSKMEICRDTEHLNTMERKTLLRVTDPRSELWIDRFCDNSFFYE